MERMLRGENFAGAPSAHIFGASAEIFFHQTGSPAPRRPSELKKQNAVGDAGHHLVDILAQRAERSRARRLELFTETGDLGAATAPRFVHGIFHGRLLIEFTCGDAVQLCGNASERSERSAAHHECEQRGQKDGAERPVGCGNQARGKFFTDQSGGEADANTAERSRAEIEG